MGKGDKKTKRGKILMGSHGVRRPKRKQTRTVPVIAIKEEKPAVPVKEKPAAKPKAVKEEVKAESPEVTAVVEEAAKPARKKSPPKASPKKEEKTEE